MLAIITNSIWRRFCKYIRREDLVNDSRFKDDYDRWEHREIIDKTVADWVANYTAEEIIAQAESIPIPAGICYEQNEVAHDPQVVASECLTDILFPDGSGRMPVTNTPLRLSASPTKVARSFPSLGQNNEEIYCSLLGYSVEDLQKLKKQGVI